MPNITASMVKELREITGVAMMDCKKALVESNGDMEEAKAYLRKKGQAKALKKSSRETTEGWISVSISEDQQQAGITRLACETDFVAKNERFQEFSLQLATLTRSELNGELNDQLLPDGTSVQDTLTQLVAELGENIQIADVQRIQVDQGVIGSYVHTTGKVGTLVGIESTQKLEASALAQIAKDIAMHVAATHVEAISSEEVSEEILEKEKEIFRAQALESGKPAEIVEKMIGGRMKKFLKEISILNQPFVKDSTITIEELLQSKEKELNTHLTLSQYAKLEF